jgi:hypothetical protein
MFCASANIWVHSDKSILAAFLWTQRLLKFSRLGGHCGILYRKMSPLYWHHFGGKKRLSNALGASEPKRLEANYYLYFCLHIKYLVYIFCDNNILWTWVWSKWGSLLFYRPDRWLLTIYNEDRRNQTKFPYAFSLHPKVQNEKKETSVWYISQLLIISSSGTTDCIEGIYSVVQNL